MGYMSFSEQIKSHLDFLNSKGLDVKSLKVDEGFVPCHPIGQNRNGRGKYAYSTTTNSMNNPNLSGLSTWCRGPKGEVCTHSTYGLLEELSNVANQTLQLRPQKSECLVLNKSLASKAAFLWKKADKVGKSDYLEAKEVGAYGIRFLINDYGRVAVIPAKGLDNSLITLQFLNPDGSKRFLAGRVGCGLYHQLSDPIDGRDIGIAESYVTAATCFELSGVAMISAFSSEHLPPVARHIRALYPNSRIVLFADNDRHHKEVNKGVEYAKQALFQVGSNSLLAFPDFGDIPPSRDASDWNDLKKLKGGLVAQEQVRLALGIESK